MSSIINASHGETSESAGSALVQSPGSRAGVGLVSREEGLTENQDLRGRHTHPQSPGCRRLYGLRQVLAKEATLGNDKNRGRWLPKASQPAS